MAMFNSPINKFIKYTTTTNEKITINVIISGLSFGDHAAKEDLSPIIKIIKNVLLKLKIKLKINKINFLNSNYL